MEPPGQAAIPEGDDALDVGDVFQARAYFFGDFTCIRCGTRLPPDAGLEGCDDRSCRQLAAKARALGWRLPEPEGEARRMDLNDCQCPACAGGSDKRAGTATDRARE